MSDAFDAAYKALKKLQAEEELERRARVVLCRTCGRELTPEHFHEENYPFRGEDGY
jgi:hypothetical protein